VQRGRFALNEIAREITLGHEPDAARIVLTIKKNATPPRHPWNSGGGVDDRGALFDMNVSEAVIRTW